MEGLKCYGAIIGDVVGSVYEFANKRSKEFPLLTDRNFCTDDSILTIAVHRILESKDYSKENIVSTLKEWTLANLDGGYGMRYFNWATSDSTEPYKSYGNGAAMRVSPVGWFANSEEEVKKLSKLVTEVTHNHPEGILGAEITAMCVYYARIGKSKDFIREYVSEYYDIDFDYEDLKRSNFFSETCEDTVPPAIFCFLESKNFEDCLRITVSIGGDTDTLCAISGAIAEAYYKEIDEDLLLEVKKRINKLNLV